MSLLDQPGVMQSEGWAGGTRPAREEVNNKVQRLAQRAGMQAEADQGLSTTGCSLTRPVIRSWYQQG